MQEDQPFIGSEIGVHKPVLCREVLQYLRPQPGDTIIDCTIGEGGHAQAILKFLSPGGRLIGIDQDREALCIAEKKLISYRDSLELVYGNFINMDRIVKEKGIDHIDGILLDLGVSSLQLDTPRRGFSIMRDGPLDMRMNPEAKVTAADLVNTLTRDEIVRILKSFGEERWASRIAGAIIRHRETDPIITTGQLTGLLLRTIPQRSPKRRIHPATRTFQAFRIAVNCELEVLDRTLSKIPGLLSEGGRVCVISYHSLEDRIAKDRIREFSKTGILKTLTKKPVRPREEEVSLNPRARSAKLRAVERIKKDVT